MKSFTNSILDVSNRFDITRVFSDFLEVSICALSCGKKEDRYLEIIKRYQSEEVNRLADSFAVLVKEMDNSGNGLKDILGGFFTEHITRGHNGQFFTPEHITDLMTALVGFDTESSPRRVLDPACGSGRMLISSAKMERRLKHVNENFYYGADLDRRCAMMTAINLCLNGLMGEVACMNSLSNEFFAGWRITFHQDFRVPFLEEISEEESCLVLHMQKQIEKVVPAVNQLSLFNF